MSKGADRSADRIDQLERQIAALTQQVQSLSVRDPEPPPHRFRFMFGFRREGTPGSWQVRNVCDNQVGDVTVEGYQAAPAAVVPSQNHRTGMHPLGYDQPIGAGVGADIGDGIPLGAPCLHLRDSNGNAWVFSAPEVQRVHWCEALEDWTPRASASVMGYDYFMANRITGAGEVSAEFQVNVPCSPGQNANIYDGDDVRYEYDDAGVAWAIEGQDLAIDSVRIWQTVAAIPRGWESYSDADDKYLFGNYVGGTSTFGTTGTDYSRIGVNLIIRVAP